METKINLELVELEPGNYHILVQADFEGADNAWWVVDTGASKSVIDQNRTEFYRIDEVSGVTAKGLGKDVVETGSGLIPQLRLGGIDFGELSVAIVDLFHINSEYSKFSEKRIIGLLGSDFLFRTNAVIDYREKSLII